MSWRARYRDLPIRQKLRLIVMLTVGAALTVTFESSTLSA